MKRFAETLIGRNDTRPLRALSMDSKACSVSVAPVCGIQVINKQGQDKGRIKDLPAGGARLLGKVLDSDFHYALSSQFGWSHLISSVGTGVGAGALALGVGAERSYWTAAFGGFRVLYLLRRGVSQNRVLPAEPQLVGLAERFGARVRPFGSRHHMDRDCAPGHSLLARQEGHSPRPARPEVSLCRACLAETFTAEIAAYPGRVVAFEPDPEILTQYFFLAAPDFTAAGLSPEVAEAIEKRLAQDLGECERCSRAATWLWFSRDHVASLDETEQIAEAKGEAFRAQHGAWKLWETFSHIPEANLFYMNLPYGEAGAYVWI